MHEPVKDGVGQRWFADVVVPFFTGQLAGHESGFSIVAVIEDLQEVTPALIGSWASAPSHRG